MGAEDVREIGRRIPGDGGVEGDEGGRTARPSRFSVALIPAAQQALRGLVARTGLSKTDVINRSLQVYGYLEDRKAEGYEVLLRKNDGTVERLQIM